MLVRTNSARPESSNLTVHEARTTPRPPPRRTIRLLFLTRETFPTGRVDIDVLFAKELVGRGHAIDFVMQAASSCYDAGRRNWHGRILYLGAAPRRAGRLGPIWRHLRAFWHQAKHLLLVARSDYDAIQVRDEFMIGALALVVARRRRLKFIFWLSFPYPLDDLLRARRGAARWPLLTSVRGRVSGWLLNRWILPYCDHAFVQSEQMKREIAARGIDASRLTAVPMGVDLSDLPLALQRGECGSKAVLLGYLGALDGERRLGVLVDMLAELVREGIDARLLLIGGTHELGVLQALRERALELKVDDRMEITGILPRPHALERLRQVQIALSPIYPSELYRVSTPTKLIEYLAMQLPVVANDIPDQKLVLRESRAGVCTPWGARHFARAVRWLLRRPYAERQQMSARGRAWLETHRTYARIADEVEKRYLEILGAAV